MYIPLWKIYLTYQRVYHCWSSYQSAHIPLSEHMPISTYTIVGAHTNQRVYHRRSTCLSARVPLSEHTPISAITGAHFRQHHRRFTGNVHRRWCGSAHINTIVEAKTNQRACNRSTMRSSFGLLLSYNTSTQYDAHFFGHVIELQQVIAVQKLFFRPRIGLQLVNAMRRAIILR